MAGRSKLAKRVALLGAAALALAVAVGRSCEPVETPQPTAQQSEHPAREAAAQAAPEDSPREPSRELPPEPSEAPAPDRDDDEEDDRFIVRWGSVGFCRGPQIPEMLTRRAALLQTFTLANRRGLEIARDATVAADVLDRIEKRLVHARQKADGLLGWSSQGRPAPIFVYKDLEQLHSVSCAPRSVAGYYDGGIHIPAANRVEDAARSVVPAIVEQTLVHEYLHHVLHSLGVSTPQWLQEGVAVAAAQSIMCAVLVRRLPSTRERMAHHHISFEKMTFAFVDAWESGVGVDQAYCQSLLMFDFVRKAPRGIPIRDLVDAIGSGRLEPEKAFSIGSGIAPDHLEEAWRKYILGDDTLWDFRSALDAFL